MRIPRRGMLALATMAGLTTILLAPQAALAAYYGNEINYAASSSGPPDNDEYYYYTDTTGAIAEFRFNGDQFYVKDTVADGHSAAAIWFDADSTRSGSCISQWGAGHYGLCDKDFVEGHTIYFSAAVYEAGKIVRNGDWIKAIA